MNHPSTTSFTRRGILGGGLGLSAAGLLSACGGGKSATGDSAATGAAASAAATAYDGPEVTLSFWNGFTGGDGAYMKKLVDKFTAEHPNVKITTQTMQWADYYAKLPTAVQAGKGPDVAIMHVDSVATNAARKIIQPLDDVAKALSLTESDFAPVPWKAGIYNDVRYSIPLDVHPMGFFYNKDVMDKAGLDADKPPTNNDEYMDALDKLKAKGIQGHWASPFQFTGGMSLYALVHQFGGSLFSDDAATATWDSEQAVKAFTWWTDLIKNGHSPAKVAQDADIIALQNGKTAFNWNGIWSINSLNEKTGLKWGVAALPTIGEKAADWAGSHQFVLPTQKTADQNKSTASRVFLNWISQQSLEWAKGGQVPARNSVRDSAEFKALTEQATIGAQINDLVFPPAVPGIADVIGEFYKSCNEVTLGSKDAATSLKESAARATKMLEANKKKYQG